MIVGGVPIRHMSQVGVLREPGHLCYSPGMPKTTEYSKPFPPMTSRARDRADSPCYAESPEDYWSCTREAGHSGNHEAGGNGGTKYAEWA